MCLYIIMGKSTDQEEQPSLKSEINTFTELSTPQLTGKCERQERVWDNHQPSSSF
jgi:hypothetical protein